MRGLRGVTEKVRGYQRKVLNQLGHKRAWRGTPRKLSLHAALLCVALFAAACSDTTDLNAGKSSPNTAAGPVTLDDQFAEVAQKAPGFGGMFYDDNGVLTAYMVQPTGELSAQAATVQQREVKGAITAVFGNEVLVSQSHKGTGVELNAQGKAELTILPGKYDFLQLRQWYRRLNNIFTVSSVVFIDIDEAKNRLTIGVERSKVGAAGRVEQELARVGIPREAVVIEATDPIFPTNHTLKSRASQMTGGLEIIFKDNRAVCTLGFNAVLNGVRGFVTNSHCTNVMGGGQNTEYYQGGYYREYFIGRESFDPSYGTCGGLQCRYSDSAFVTYSASARSAQGYISRTTSRTNVPTYTSDQSNNIIRINDSYPTIRIVAERNYPLVGDRLEKIGRSTGWTTGVVADGSQAAPVGKTCADARQSGPQGTPDKLFLCQYYVYAGVYGGDSGSSVFKIHSNGTATLHGILWGGNTGTPERPQIGTFFIFSPMANVRFEMSVNNRYPFYTY